jgi:hypothetical protein
MRSFLFLIVFNACLSRSFAQSVCLDLFTSHRLSDIQSAALELDDYQFQKYFQQGQFLEASRRASTLHKTDLAQKLEEYVTKILTTDTVKGFPNYLHEGTTEVYLVTFNSGLKAIFKPDAKFWVIDSKKENHYLSNSFAEVASYSLSQILGLHLVPVTVRRTIDGKTGSLQAFIKGEKTAGTKLLSSEILENDAVDLHIFDFLIRNSDRVEKNMLIGDSYLWAIDNGSSFHLQKTSASSPKIKELRLGHMSPSFLANLYATTPDIIRTILKEYPNKKAIEELILRREEILRNIHSWPYSRN